jgi:hypothetical protein
VTCEGPCTAGYACSPGSVVATSFICPPGMYSNTSAFSCSACPSGRYSPLPGQPFGCPSLCDAGQWGSLGATNSSCSGLCAPGCYCTAGSASSCPASCPVGTYSVGGAGDAACTPCPAGLYGSSTGLKAPACTGVDALCCFQLGLGGGSGGVGAIVFH